MTGQFRPERMELGEVPAEDISIDPRSRDDVSKFLRGIRSLVTNREFWTKLESPMEAGFLTDADGGQECPGMGLGWILVFGVLERDLGRDFDRVPHRAYHDKLVREFLGNADFIDECECKRRTPADNVRHPRPS